MLKTQISQPSNPRLDRLHRPLAIACWVLASMTALLISPASIFLVPFVFLGPPGHFLVSLLPILVIAGAINFALHYSPVRRPSSGIGFSGLAFLAPFIVHVSMQWIGFPDGSRTQFERAIEFVFPIFCVLSCSIGLCFLYLAWSGRRSGNCRGLGAASLGMVGLFAAAIATEYWLYSILDHGVGG